MTPPGRPSRVHGCARSRLAPLPPSCRPPARRPRPAPDRTCQRAGLHRGLSEPRHGRGRHRHRTGVAPDRAVWCRFAQMQPILDDLTLGDLREEQIRNDAILRASLRRLKYDFVFLLKRTPPAGCPPLDPPVEGTHRPMQRTSASTSWTFASTSSSSPVAGWEIDSGVPQTPGGIQRAVAQVPAIDVMAGSLG